MMRARRLTCTVLVSLGVLIFATPALAAGPPEAPITGKATAITGTTATLHGVLNPKGPATAKAGWYFAYSFEPTCGGVFASPLEPEVEGEALPEQAEITIGVEPSRKYTFCMVATNALGEATQGTQESFETPALAPAIDSENGAPLTPFEGSLETQVNANNQATTVYFQYSTSPAKALSGSLSTPTQIPPPPGTEIGGGFGDVPVGPTALTGLTAGTPYYYQAVAINATGTTYGTIKEFATPPSQKPAVDSEGVTEGTLTSTDASLEAKVNPNYQETTYSFEYATSAAALGTPSATTVQGAPPAPKLTAVLEEQLAGPVDLKNALAPGTHYYYRVLATNKTGTTVGTATVQSFITLDKPVVTTGQASGVTRESATLTGAVNPAGAPTAYYFSYIDEAGYLAALGEGAADPYAHGAGTPEITVAGTYGAQSVIPLTASQLRPGVTYHYALVASNSVGTVIGPDRTFTTEAPIPPPGVSAGEAVDIAYGAATLKSTIETRGLPTTTSFEFGLTPYSGTLEGTTTLPGSEAPVSMSYTFNGYLLPGTVYYYRVVATNAYGTSYGPELSFSTTQFPSAAATPTTPLLGYATPGEAKAGGKPPAPPKQCKKGMTLKKGKCTKIKVKAKKKTKKKGRK
jgi:hypothetical protein